MAGWPPLQEEVDRLRVRFLKRMDGLSNEACWIWPGAKDSAGYGRMTVCRDGAKPRYRDFFVHRLAILFDGRRLDVGECALHSCDNPACCNPRHLRVGTIAENNRDRASRNRKSWPRGSAAGNAKLTESQVLEIHEQLARGVLFKHIAAKYGVSMTVIGGIRGRGKLKCWEHMKPSEALDGAAADIR